MNALSIFCKSVKVSLDTGPDIRDITPALEQLYIPSVGQIETAVNTVLDYDG